MSSFMNHIINTQVKTDALALMKPKSGEYSAKVKSIEFVEVADKLKAVLTFEVAGKDLTNDYWIMGTKNDAYGLSALVDAFSILYHTDLPLDNISSYQDLLDLFNSFISSDNEEHIIYYSHDKDTVYIRG